MQKDEQGTQLRAALFLRIKKKTKELQKRISSFVAFFVLKQNENEIRFHFLLTFRKSVIFCIGKRENEIHFQILKVLKEA